MSYDYIVGIIVFVHGNSDNGIFTGYLKTSIYDTPRRAAVVISAYDI